MTSVTGRDLSIVFAVPALPRFAVRVLPVDACFVLASIGVLTVVVDSCVAEVSGFEPLPAVSRFGLLVAAPVVRFTLPALAVVACSGFPVVVSFRFVSEGFFAVLRLALTVFVSALAVLLSARLALLAFVVVERSLVVFFRGIRGTSSFPIPAHR